MISSHYNNLFRLTHLMIASCKEFPDILILFVVLEILLSRLEIKLIWIIKYSQFNYLLQNNSTLFN